MLQSFSICTAKKRLLTERFDSRSKIASIRIPKLFIHGECDEKVPPDMTDELFEVACEKKEFFKI